MGVRARLNEYALLKRALMPLRVNQYLDKGWEITTSGLICWCPMPSPFTVGKTRVKMIALEACVAYIFGASPILGIDDSIWGDLWPWERSTFAWDALCTHTAFMEVPRGTHNMTEAEFIEYNKRRREEALAKANKKSQEHRARKRALDLPGFLAQMRDEKREWSKANHERANEIARGVRARAIASGKHRCDVYGTSFPGQFQLNLHNTRKSHLRNVQLVAEGKPIHQPVQSKYVKKMRESGQHKCDPCGYISPTPALLLKHQKTKKHQKIMDKVTSAAAAA